MKWRLVYHDSVPDQSRRHLSSAPVVAVLVALTALCVAAVNSRPRVIPEAEVDNRPNQLAEDGFVSSNACQTCHPAEYESWYGSFHRTMTQVAMPGTVQADFSDVTVPEVPGRPMRLERRGDEFWAEFDDPGWEGPGTEQNRPRITRQVVMITGSHYQQIYWYATGHDRGLNVLPGVFLLDDQRWVSRSAVVLHPPGQSVATLDGHWNAICVACHTTSPKTKFDTPFGAEPFDQQTIDTTTTEFGIACEACHGPGGEHARANRDPFRRYLSHLSAGSDSTIIQPALLDPQRSSQVCGQCHSVWEFYNPSDERVANSEGFPYRPGDELTDTRFIAQPMQNRREPMLQKFLSEDTEFVRGSFWSDGMIRVSGREYNGLIDSPCFRDATEPEETLSCFSCHTMHQLPDDPRSIETWAATHQVSSPGSDNEACVQCHATIESDVSAHSNHPLESSGSRCYNCHMPYTSYGLLKAIRSHTVSSPSVAETIDVGRPNACNLCHLDKTLAWTGNALYDWYGTPPPALSEDESMVAASLLWMLKGDAGLRALTAWNLGWQPAQEASGTRWMAPHLAELMSDPYEAVRYIAYRSLRTLPGYTAFDYDYLATHRERVDRVLPALQKWRASTLSRQRREPELLVDTDGTLRTDVMRELFDLRDNRPLFLRE